MTSERTTTVLTLVAIVLTVGAGHAAAQELCDDGRSPSPWIGVHAFHCPGGACELNDWTTGSAYDFSSEPWLRAVDTDGPGADLLEEGDILVAVNGYLITTVAGGRELATLAPDRSAALTLRRGDRLEQVDLEPELRCEPVLLLSGTTVVNVPLRNVTVRPDASGATPRGGFHTSRPNLGAAFACRDCAIFVSEDRGYGWLAAGPVEVRGVTAGSPAEVAGLRPGDRVVAADGHTLESHQGLDALLGAPAGASLTLDVERDGQTFELVLGIPPGEEPGNDSPSAVMKRGQAGWGASTFGNLLGYLRLLNVSLRPTGGRSPRLTISGDSWGPSSLGATFSCGDACAWRLDDGRRRWQLNDYLRVIEVEPDGPADVAGLRTGDVLRSINGHDLLSRDAGDLFVASDAGDVLRLVVRREGSDIELTLTAR